MKDTGWKYARRCFVYIRLIGSSEISTVKRSSQLGMMQSIENQKEIITRSDKLEFRGLKRSI